MKKMRLLLCLGAIALSLASCGEGPTDTDPESHNGGDNPSGPTEDPTEEHKHTYSSSWSSDETYHWHQATCEHKDLYIDKAEHTFNWKTVVQPQEGKEGREEGICRVCAYRTERSIDALQHRHVPYTSYGDGVEPTCTEDGYQVIYTYCETCGEKLSEEKQTLRALGHDLRTSPGRIPTCTDDGYESYQYCTRCNYTTDIVVINATGHTKGEQAKENIVEATCTEAGSYDLVTYCADCRMKISTETVIVAALGHDLVHHEETDSTCTERGHYEYDTCSRCDYSTIVEKDLLRHNIWLRTVVKTYPTGRTAGTYDYYWRCSVCNQSVSSGKKKETGNSTHLSFGNIGRYHDVNAYVGGNVVPDFTNSSDYKTEWLVENTNILSVNENNEVIGIKVGTSMLWAYTQGYEIAAVRIHVLEDELKLKLPQSNFYPGDTFEMDFETFTRNKRSILSWESSDESIATVDENGMVEVLDIGEVTITAKSEEFGLEDSISFTSMKHFATLKRTEVNIGRLESDTIFQSISRVGIISWTSSNPNIAQADGNWFSTGEKYGTATLTASSEYLDEDLVLVVHVVEVSASLSSNNYTQYCTATFDVHRVSASIGMNWNVKITLEMKNLWQPEDDIRFVLEFSFRNSISYGTMYATVIIDKDSLTSKSTYVMPCAYNDSSSKPSYTISSVSGTVKK